MWKKIAVVTACFGLMIVVGCSRPGTSRPAATAVDGFQAVIDRLQAESQAKSVHGTAITLSTPADGPDGRRVVTARRTRGDSTTVFTLEFKPSGKGWACHEAVAEETGPGSNRTAHRLTGKSIELDQLIKWLNW